MNEAKIVAILPNNHLTQGVAAAQNRMGIEFPIHHRQVHEALVLARETIRNGVKVIISRGLTAEYLRKNLDIPVVEIEYDFFQFAEAMRRALSLSKNVAVIGLIDVYHLADRAVDYVKREGERIQVRILESPADIEDCIRDLAELGFAAFIGGNTVVRTARALGHEGVYVEPDEKVIETAIEKACYELRIYLEREEKFEMTQAIINCATNGIFAVDGNGAVTLANPLARKHIQGDRPPGYPLLVRDIMPGSKLLDTIRTGEPASEDFITLGGTELVMNAASVVVDGEIRGAVATIQEIGQIQDLDHKIRKKLLHKGHIAQKHFSDIIGRSPAMRAAIDAATSFAAVDSTILILGKTGTGKEVFAQSIHNASRRAAQPFVAVNCAALPSSLLESELFGYAKGAFTGARTEGKAGIFELAHSGTIFLDEISEIPPEVQARLLRVVQEKEITRIGDDKVIPVDVRILAASNRNLLEEVAAHRFREDLYYRLAVLELRLPALVERRDDIPDLVRHFVRSTCLSAGRTPIEVQNDALALLQTLPLPGNVRELCNIVEKTLVMSNFGRFDRAGLENAIFHHLNANHSHNASVDLTTPVRARPERGNAPDADPSPGASLAEMERSMILRTLEACDGNRNATARRLGISPTTLWRRLKDLGVCP